MLDWRKIKGRRVAFSKSKLLTPIFPERRLLTVRASKRKATAIGLLASPFASMLLTLDKPFWINEVPHSEFDIYRDSHYESLNSWIKIYFLDLSGSRDTSFVFNFVWQNDSDSYVVINASSRLALGIDPVTRIVRFGRLDAVR
jgi:hypothetical protein